MSAKIGNRGIRWLIAGGVALMFVGGCVAGFADGFGDARPSLAASRRQRWIGGAIRALGVVTAVGSAIGLYVIENRRRD